MQRGPTAWRRRVVLRRLARQIREEDPELARVLSRRRTPVLPPLRITSLSVTGYAVTAAVLTMSGSYLGVISAVWAGLILTIMAVVRWRHGDGSGPGAGSPRVSPADDQRLDGRRSDDGRSDSGGP